MGIELCKFSVSSVHCASAEIPRDSIYISLYTVYNLGFSSFREQKVQLVPLVPVWMPLHVFKLFSVWYYIPDTPLSRALGFTASRLDYKKTFGEYITNAVDICPLLEKTNKNFKCFKLNHLSLSKGEFFILRSISFLSLSFSKRGFF